MPAVELIHDLYNQYDFKVNAVRFRNTVTIWRDGIVNSYAPIFEWNAIASLLGDKFYRLDPLLVSELTKLYDSDRNFVTTYLENLNLSTISIISNVDLRNIFINIQNFTLGDLYRLNFVQVEHALTSAICRVLEELNIDRNELASLIVTEQLTEFQKEELAFARMAVELVGKDRNEQERALQKHWDDYAYMHCAYGELPYPLEHYWEKFERFDSSQVNSIEQDIISSANESSKKVSAIGSPKLTELVNLMKRGGVFRDNNKARLGQTMRYKFVVLEEIARRCQIDREELRFYSVYELCRLLESAEQVDDSILAERKENGVVLVRGEYYGETDSSDSHIDKNFIRHSVSKMTSTDLLSDLETTSQALKLQGLGASPGRVTGYARIVFSYEDGHKVKDGDIMIAIGTDFDLMDAIQRSSAVVTEEGGFLSHASVVCRELKKPCCIAVEDATHLIQDGDIVEIDAGKGVITVIRK